MNIGGHVEAMYPRGVRGLSFKSSKEIWDFFEYLTRDTCEDEKVIDGFSCLIHNTNVCPFLAMVSRYESQLNENLENMIRIMMGKFESD